MWYVYLPLRFKGLSRYESDGHLEAGMPITMAVFALFRDV
jgi:hypothetical protein